MDNWYTPDLSGWDIDLQELENRETLIHALPFHPDNVVRITILELWSETYPLTSQEIRWQNNRPLYRDHHPLRSIVTRNRFYRKSVGFRI